jgi:O-succinylbenzoate synthase
MDTFTMHIKRIEVFRYAIPFVEALNLLGRSFVLRSGLLIRLEDGDGRTGVGEAAPLPGYSPDTIEEALEQVATLADLAGQAIPDGVERLDGGFEAWLGARSLVPSLRCGLEMAALNLLAAEKGVPLRKLIGAEAREAVIVMGLLNGNLGEIRKKAQYLHTQGYRAVKLKVGRFELADDVQTTVWLGRNFGGEVSLRLDANRAWDYDTAINYARQTEDCEVAYIEEPVNDPSTFGKFADESGMAVALDESLRDLPVEELRAQPNFTTVVIKPTVLGLERSVRLARRGRELGMSPVISSSFESGLGLSALAQVAAAVQKEVTPCGLDTYEWLDGDVFNDRVPLRKPIIDLRELETLTPPVAFDKLRKVS